MIILLVFAFVSGLITILAPCIWPLLPIIFSTSAANGSKSKSFGITLGIMISFSIFTLSISYLVSFFHFDPNILRLLAVFVIGFMGLSLVVPSISAKFETLLSKLSFKRPGLLEQRKGLWGGLLTGLSLGLVWSPCAGPILASIAALSTTQNVSFGLVLVTFSYVVGVGIPLFFFSYAGSQILTRTKALSPYLGKIQRVFGVIMILTALAIYTNYDKVLQVKLLEFFPSYTNLLTKLESNPSVISELKKLKGVTDMPIPTAGVLSNISNVNKTSNLPKLGRAPEFAGINNWLNSKPLAMADLKGKAVLIDFWTYTCINCIRTLPHVTSWYEKYKDQGLVVVGVHTPEFEFEKKTENVANAIKQYKITYPVAQDNDYATWNAYDNHYWPAKYLIDAQGYIRYTHFGEGEYETTEMNIKKLLEEAGSSVDQNVVDMPDETPKSRLTPETYLGSARMDRFISREQITENREQKYTIDPSVPIHYWGYEGNWTVGSESAIAGQNASLTLSFYASKVFLVIHPATGEDKVQVYLDGKLIGEVIVTEPKLYNLIDLGESPNNHLLRLEFLTPGTQLFAFTFG